MGDSSSYLDGLNPSQLEAVVHTGSPLLILAGAGSGKTRVITTKIAYLVRELGYAPESILAVTFTNKAAREMQARARAIEPQAERAMIRTFHSFGAWFLRRNGGLAGLDSGFTIYDDEDAATLLSSCLPELARKDRLRLASAISRAKDFGLEPDSPGLVAISSEPSFRRAYAEYEKRLRASGNADFGDLIRLPARILREDAAVRARINQRFRAILVDEYQDSNVGQFELLRLLAGSGQSGSPGAYVCVVGDDDQSIYRFRGAEVRNILGFPDHFPGTTIVRLEENYRSYQSILDTAHAVVSRNKGRLGKELHAVKEGGPKPRLAILADEAEEAAYCARVVERRIRAGGSASDVAILYRTNAQSLAFEDFFVKARIAYRIVGALRFYEREEVKDGLAWLSLAANPRDEVAFRRVVNKPSRGVGEVASNAVADMAVSGGIDFVSASEALAPSMKGKAKTGLAAFAAIARSLASELDGKPPAPEPGERAAKPSGRRDAVDAALGRLVARAFEDSGLLEYHKAQDEIQGAQKEANIDQLVNAASIFPPTREGLAEFLEMVMLDSAQRAEEGAEDAVTLITMHNTKGLEFPVVIVTGLEQGLFPRGRGPYATVQEGDDEDLEEERRLFYVAITRAMDELHLTSCRMRRRNGRVDEQSPSSFLYEIPKEGLEVLGGRLPMASAPGSSPFKAGMAVYHEDYGAGAVVQVKGAGEAGTLVLVRFESGRTAQFFPKYAPKLEIQKE